MSVPKRDSIAQLDGHLGSTVQLTSVVSVSDSSDDKDNVIRKQKEFGNRSKKPTSNQGIAITSNPSVSLDTDSPRTANKFNITSGSPNSVSNDDSDLRVKEQEGGKTLNLLSLSFIAEQCRKRKEKDDADKILKESAQTSPTSPLAMEAFRETVTSGSTQ